MKSKSQTFILCSMMLLMCLHFSDALGAIINVPTAEYSTIQAGIDAANNGDTVLVADGIYTGEGNKNLDFKGKMITVISANGPNTTIIDCENDGRGVWFNSGEGENSVLSGFTITKGRAYFGGGIACINSSPTITNCIIIENTADMYTPYDGLGGGIYCEASAPIIKNSTINKNSASQYGGGIASTNGSSPDITDCSINENLSGRGGSGVFSSEGSLSLAQCTIRDNTGAAFSGGGIKSNDSTTVITDCVIRSNRAGTGGGGVSCGGGSLKITDSTISENEATSTPNYGGGISSSNAEVIITGSTISQNTAGGGGGIHCKDGNVDISRCIIAENQSFLFRSDGYGGGGGIFCPNSTGSISSCLIVNNSAVLGGGISTDGTSPHIAYCTVSQNSASGYRPGNNVTGGGIYVRNSSPVIASCILWENSPEEIFVVGGFPVVTYSAVQNGWSGEGNISYYPEFLNTSNGDYHLADISPCIGTGTNDGATDFDLEANPRPNPPGSTPDMGAYENSRGIPAPDIFGMQVGNQWTYQGSDVTGAYVSEQEVASTDQSTFPTTTYVVEGTRDGTPWVTEWYERTSNELKLWGQREGSEFYRYGEGLVVVWYPMQVNDHRESSGTVSVAGYIFDISMSVDALAVESIEIGFDTFEAYKLRYIFRIWGYGYDDSTTFYHWVVPYIGFIKIQDDDSLRILSSFGIGAGTITQETDADDDGLKDYQELIIYGTDFLDTDTDNDGMPDGWEVAYGLDPKSDDSSDDFDGDGVSNLIEYRRRTDPTDPDDYPAMTMPWMQLLLLGPAFSFCFLLSVL